MRSEANRDNQLLLSNFFYIMSVMDKRRCDKYGQQSGSPFLFFFSFFLGGEGGGGEELLTALCRSLAS